MEEKLSLLEKMFDIPLKCVFKYLDMGSIFRLSAVSRTMRGRVHYHKPDLKIKGVTITIGENDLIRITIKDVPGGLRWYSMNCRYGENDPSDLNRLAKRFGFIMSFEQPNPIVFEISLSSFQESHETYDSFFNMMLESFEANETILSVSEMCAKIPRATDVSRIWQHTKPELLKSLEVKNVDVGEYFDGSNLVLHPHWSSILELRSSCFFNGPDSLLFHFENVDFKISRMTLSIIKKFLKGLADPETKNRRYHITFDEFVDRDQLSNEFAADGAVFSPPNDPEWIDGYWHFKSASQKTELIVSTDRTTVGIYRQKV